MDERHLPGKVDWLGGQPPLLVRANIVMIGLRSDIDYGISRAVLKVLEPSKYLNKYYYTIIVCTMILLQDIR